MKKIFVLTITKSLNAFALDLCLAGGTVVHISAGFSALIASLVVGERSASSQQMRAHNVPFVLLGAALLNFGWYWHLFVLALPPCFSYSSICLSQVRIQRWFSLQQRQ
jgi:uncharacterized membrane-anchored protein YitT (DUF2179 family)